MLVEQLVNKVFNDYEFPLVRTIGHLNGYNYYEEDGNLVVEINAAGIKKKDIDLSVSDDRLKVKSEDYLNKVITLPKNADIDNIQASHTDGLLKVMIPLSTKKRSIKIK
jgi:HSP20 family molecular chaperone IbpA